MKKLVDMVEIDEESTTDGVAGYETPNAFGELPDSAIEVYGYRKVKSNRRSKFMELAATLHLSNL